MEVSTFWENLKFLSHSFANLIHFDGNKLTVRNFHDQNEKRMFFLELKTFNFPKKI